MALRDQPYLPLYIQDFITDEKLIECSASATGVYIRIMCLMHKSEFYGQILLKQNYKQSDKQSLNFASQIAKFLPYDLDIISSGIEELLREKVLQIEGDFLQQKRMIKDNAISKTRSESGFKGGKSTQSSIKKFAKAKTKANTKSKKQANTENEIDIENEIESIFKGSVWDNEEMNSVWARWVDYKKGQFKDVYKSKETEKAAGRKLWELSGGNQGIAIKIINESISNLWKGLFKLKDESNGITQQSNARLGENSHDGREYKL